MRRALVAIALSTLIVGCATTPPLDPVMMDEVIQLSKHGPNGPALVQALTTRPLGFPLTYESLKRLSEEGVPDAVIDTVLALSLERRARALAPRYGYYDPWFHPWHWRYPGPYYYRVP